MFEIIFGEPPSEKLAEESFQVNSEPQEEKVLIAKCPVCKEALKTKGDVNFCDCTGKVVNFVT